jgi:hypothetical protein
MTNQNNNSNQDPNQDPNTDPNQKPNQDPNQDPGSSEELKPLTDAEMESMTTDEITAHAEKLEAQVKGSKKQTDDQIRQNQIIRAKKAQEKAFANSENSNTDPSQPADKKDGEVAQGDLLTLSRKTEFELGSDEQKTLQWYVENGKVKNYAEALEHPAVKAELEALQADSNATAVIDENDSDEVKLQTKKEAIANARASGEIPEDPELQKAIVDDNLSNMSSLK